MAKKRSTYEVIDREAASDLYDLMEELRGEYHDDLEGASIALAWRHGWKADPDGRVILGQMKKAADLDRQLHDFDFILLLNFEVWSHVEFSEAQKRALLDHELCHGARALDADREPRYTPDGRAVYRIRKHTIEEFHEIVERHGQWKGDIQTFVERAMAAGIPEQLTIHERIVDTMIDNLATGKGSSAFREAAEQLAGDGGVTISANGRSVTLPPRSKPRRRAPEHRA
jgi:hypothetical protein